ncbi:hypothetical protein SAY86_022437 [Trapa natans]|uniref:Transcription termination factor MTEF1, chloroplastic n=1 Tax=Trapa natans TaxID=22666 RepID=A0AAN7R6Z3_TRANT|nr:hypothetical protein SAY86_022437 [Trapa natans]
MQETLHLLSNIKPHYSSSTPPPPPPHVPHHDSPSLSRPKTLPFSSSSAAATAAASAAVYLPQKPPKTRHHLPALPSPPSDFEAKMLYLDSLGIDFLSLIGRHPPLVSAPLPSVRSTVDFLLSMDFNIIELRRIFGMCPQALSLPPADLIPVFTFLLREARVAGSDLRGVINRRPRILASPVSSRLRPTLYFLQSIGISQVNKHTNLLSCSVEDKLIPRIEYFKKVGFSHKDSIRMFRRFPQMFCYSIKENLEPKFNYFVVEMGRDLKELREFPQYFSFSLENRIKPRHQSCVEKGVCFPLPVLLKTSNQQFLCRLDVCCNSSMPFSSSPLWCTNCEDG